MAMRKLAAEGLVLMRRHTAALELTLQLERAYSSLPEDLAAAARRAKFPPRRAAPPPATSFAASAEAATASKTPMEVVEEGAKIASSWMFPWERRQMEGTGKLRTWEKLYWGVFVVAISIFLFNRAHEWTKSDDKNNEEEDAAKEEARKARAREVAAGASALVPWGSDDPLDGMTPEEVQAFVEETTGGGKKVDPFEGMDPGEIDTYVKAYTAKHGVPPPGMD